MPPVALPARFTCYIYPPNHSGYEESDCSCLVHFSTTILCRIWTGLARELKLEGLRFVFLFLAFVHKAFCYCFVGTAIFWSFLDL